MKILTRDYVKSNKGGLVEAVSTAILEMASDPTLAKIEPTEENEVPEEIVTKCLRMLRYHLNRVASEIISRTTVLPDQVETTTISPTDSPEVITTKNQISSDIHDLKQELNNEAVAATDAVFEEKIESLWSDIEENYNSGFEKQRQK